MGNEIVLTTPDEGEFKGKGSELVKQAQLLTIDTQDDYDVAGQFLTEIKGVFNRLWDRLDEPCKKANAAWKSMVKIRDEAVQPYSIAENLIKQKMGAFQFKIEEKRRQEQAKADAKAREEAESKRRVEILEAKKRKDMEAVENLKSAPLEVISAPIKTQEVAKVAGVSSRKVWKVAKVNAAELPSRYLMPDMKAIEQVVKALGARHGIPGVSVIEETVISARGQ